MTLQISLLPNHLTTETEDDYMAIVRNVPYKTEDDIIKQITGPGSILKSTECVAVINAYWNAIAENLKEGIGFTSQHVNVTPAAGGVFDSVDEAFDPQRHWKDVNVTAGRTLRKSCLEMNVITKREPVPLPYVMTFVDIRTGAKNQTITPGFMADITGDLLKIEGAGAGVFFINTSTSTVTQVTNIHINEPKTLQIVIPNLAAGSYRLEIRSHVRGSKELRSGMLNSILTVA